jgi:hypothetical protein
MLFWWENIKQRKETRGNVKGKGGKTKDEGILKIIAI